jgi:serine/threonine protein kinase
MAYNLSDYMDPAYERFDGARDRARVVRQRISFANSRLFLTNVQLREMAEGLCYLHSNYVVHGDIKPVRIAFTNVYRSAT